MDSTALFAKVYSVNMCVYAEIHTCMYCLFCFLQRMV